MYGAYSFFDKVVNGCILYAITAFWNTNADALKWIMGLTPVICAVAAFLLTYLGKILYAERLASLSVAKASPSINKKKRALV